MKNLTGKRFGRLVAKKIVGRDKNRNILWLCRCDCGKETVVCAHNLRKGHTKSCGCLLLKHEHNRRGKVSKTYRAWQNMNKRCTNPNDPSYKNYGGRIPPIKVCYRWSNKNTNGFQNFLKDISEIPKGMTLERINNNKGYFPNNCQQTTRKRQNRNKRNNRFYHFNNKNQILNDWAKEYNIQRQTLSYRLNKGMSIEKALTTPIRKRKIRK